MIDKTIPGRLPISSRHHIRLPIKPSGPWLPARDGWICLFAAKVSRIKWDAATPHRS